MITSNTDGLPSLGWLQVLCWLPLLSHSFSQMRYLSPRDCWACEGVSCGVRLEDQRPDLRIFGFNFIMLSIMEFGVVGQFIIFNNFITVLQNFGHLQYGFWESNT